MDIDAVDPPLLHFYSYNLLLLLLVSVVLFLRHHRRRRSLQVAANGATGPGNHRPQSNPVLGNLVAFLRNGHRFLDWTADLLAAAPASTMQVLGPLGGLGYCGVDTANPEVIDHIVRANFPSYVKGARIRAAFADLLGDGLFLANGRLWTLQRKLASYSFSSRLLRRFSSRVLRDHIHRRLVPFLAAAADSGEAVDLQDVLRRFTFDNICSVAFGVDDDRSSALLDDHRHGAFFAAFDDAVDISFGRILHPTTLGWRVMKLLDVGSERRLRLAIAVVDEYVTAILQSKQQRQSGNSEDEPDLLSRFKAAMEEDEASELGRIFASPEAKRRFLRDTVVTFVLAGKDTTSSALTWFFWFLAANPRCERRVYEEVTSLALAPSREADADVGRLADGDVESEDGYDELKGMHYLHAAITETMRLYPPVPMVSRVAVHDDVLPDGTVVRAGWFADYSAYAMGRSARVWGDDCRVFRPERWLDGRGRFVSAEAARYPVFNAGPRACLGKEMSYLQMKVVAAAVVRRFTVEVLVPAGSMDMAPEHEMAVTLKMKGGLRVRFKNRARAA
ncbi:cytochrome P450 CYP94D108-like [Aegilops tauschii subsp. strangulata]|nr:cytochrome P450 94A2-like [Aegilops tauschii subsp. strangulata]